jgi:hypothetical protein
MDKIIYALCTLTAVATAALLLRAYVRTRYRLLLWSGLCFVGLTVSNVLLVLDRLVFPTADLSTWRLAAGMVAVLLLVSGLILEGDA